MMASLVFIPSPNLFFNKLRPILQQINRTAKCAWKRLPRRSAGLALLSLPAACSLCWCEAACLAGEKGKAWSELFEYCRQVFHSSWNSLFVGPGIAKDQPPARQRLQAIGRDGQDLNTNLRGQLGGAPIIFAGREPADKMHPDLGSVHFQQTAQVSL